ncbi:hypothetical protein Z946_622 [Sulfitobacter noctilucicola]|uniref:Uncharacterized protein n=1 Tax=Sulfitobacter noctilucicola TaxID=1342301 RepID=A0A7W6MBE4_9RHOB|nr:hypothetical protein [Sulfitobacter noctilucicola]KIN66143.1 hypothetical protein Z946_622 [Sulfitobacter noctilucicola]MBB4175829.1 hypothetical protein [Sulfitobacter noctilucicola]
MTQRTYFGLPVISRRGVRPADIARLPFAQFWCDSAVRSSQIQDTATGEWLVNLRDWENFASMFIETGRHRNMPQPKQVAWFDRDEGEPERTYFGLEITGDKMVREADIARLPFYDFWRDSSRGSAALVDPKTDTHLVYLHDWEAFAKLLIETGRHRFMPHLVET